MQEITPQEVNGYLPKNKWQVSETGGYSEPNLEINAREQVLGRLASVYPVDEWRAVDGEAPPLVRQVIAMYIAAWIYARQFGEDTANIHSYAAWLLRQAEVLLASIADGTISLEEEEFPHGEGAGIESGEPIFTTGEVF